MRTGAAGADTPTIWVIGDSTASVYSADLYPRTGWAQPLQDYFVPACARVQDKALSGRSSKSFYDEGAWTPIHNALRAGDFVLIQFGHNDEKSDDALRYTEPSKTYKQFLTHYIDDTEAKGATAILMTSIERNKWTNGQLTPTHGAYPDAVRQLAEARKLTLIDMTKLTHDYFQNLGQTATTALFLNLSPGQFPNYPNGNSDDTHLQERGAHIVAEIALADLARQRVALAALLEHVPAP
jgi:lysophospholipase L1-like esterase